MSRKLTRPKAGKRQSSAEKTKATAVSKTTFSSPPEPVPTLGNPEALPNHTSLQSIIPPTDDIDSDWGEFGDAEDDSGPVLTASDVPAKVTVSAHAHTAVEFNRSETPASGIPAVRISSLPPAVKQPTIPSARRQTPERGTPAAISERPLRTSNPPRSLSPAAGVPSTPPPPPSSRIRNPPAGPATGLSDVPSRPSTMPRSLSPTRGIAQARPSTPPPRSATPAAGMPAVRPSQAPESRSSSVPQSARTDLAPRPSAPRSSTPAAGTPAGRSEEPSRPSAPPRTLSPAAGLAATRPSTPAARLKTQVAEGQAELAEHPAEAVATSRRPAVEAKPAHVEVTPPAAAFATSVESPVAAAASQPSTRAPSAATPNAVAAMSAPPTFPTVDSTYPGSPSKLRLRLALGVLWVVTAAIPAVVVWLSMRTPAKSALVSKPTIERHEPAPPSIAPAQKLAAQQPPADTLSNVTPNPAEMAVAPAIAAASEPASAAIPSAVASPTASSPSAAASVVVETDSADRVSVLVKSRPTGAKVYRRGKEIGRTPLTVQIGRGEHRIFEVGWTNAGSKRISVDGEKPEITVTLLGEPKAPAPSGN